MLTRQQARTSGLVAVILFAGLVAWRLWSDEARGISRRRPPAPSHEHTFTFTCSDTCTNLTTLPEQLWRR